MNEIRQGSESVALVHTLRERYGAEVELTGAVGAPEVFRILAEFEFGGRVYAILQSRALRKNDEVAVFRTILSPQGEPEIESVEDDEEWETIAEIYDDMMFPEDEDA